jgi:hypothetical protein
MTTQSLGHSVLKELMVWTAAIMGGVLTFHYFEPVYDRIQHAAIRGGYVRVLGFDFDAAAVPQFDTRVTTVAPPFRGTIAAAVSPPPCARPSCQCQYLGISGRGGSTASRSSS